MKKVIRLTESELTSLIRRIVVETREEEYEDMDYGMEDELYEDMDYEDEDEFGGEMDEGLYDFFKRAVNTVGGNPAEAFEEELNLKMRNYAYMTGERLSREEKEELKDRLRAEAESDKYQGEMRFFGPEGNRELRYIPSDKAEDRSGFIGFR